MIQFTTCLDGNGESMLGVPAYVLKNPKEFGVCL